ncbi:MAG: CarD family transcriptional regulator [Hyphomicrobiaceae bacterium]
MARKTTLSKSAAKKADARKPSSKASIRSATSQTKTVPRKGQHLSKTVAKTQHSPKAADHGVAAALKKPAAPAKHAVAKAPPKPAVAAVKPAPAVKPALPKAVIARPGGVAPAAASGVPRQPMVLPKHAIPPRAFGVAPPKAPVQKTMPARQQAAVSKQAATAAVAAAAAASKKPVSQRHGFKTNEWIVYPAHGVGRIVGIEEQEIAGMSLELFVITFEKDKMTLRVPTGKSQSVGMRKLAEEGVVKRAMETLKGRARVKRTMWSRRAQEYEAKINSGDLVAIAEVVRDLYRSESQPEQSYSERQLYEAALDRMAREIAAVERLDERGAVQRITEVLSKSAKGRRIAAEEAEVKAA